MHWRRKERPNDYSEAWNLETVCGITSTLAGEHITGDRICGEIKCRKIVTDQCDL